jgi:hypothetical protein
LSFKKQSPPAPRTVHDEVPLPPERGQRLSHSPRKHCAGRSARRHFGPQQRALEQPADGRGGTGGGDWRGDTPIFTRAHTVLRPA